MLGSPCPLLVGPSAVQRYGYARKARSKARGDSRGGEMAATSDAEMDSLLQTFEHIYQGYKDAAIEIRSLKSSCFVETTRRAALEAACNDLKADNERLRKLRTESLTKMMNQVKYHSTCQTLKEELKKADDKLLNLEDEHKKTIELLKQERELKIHDLEKQISSSLLQQAADQAVIRHLQQELTAHKSQVEILTNNLKQVTADINLKYNNEIQDLKDWILIEQEEKSELHNKLQNAENELLILKAKQAEQQRESISIRHVETLKQKIMKLRKENESLKRQLNASEHDGA